MKKPIIKIYDSEEVVQSQYGSDDLLNFIFDNHWEEFDKFTKKIGFKYVQDDNPHWVKVKNEKL